MLYKLSRLYPITDCRNKARHRTLVSSHLRNNINYYTLCNKHNNSCINSHKTSLSNLFHKSVPCNKLLRNKHTGKHHLSNLCHHKLGSQRLLLNQSATFKSPFP